MIDANVNNLKANETNKESSYKQLVKEHKNDSLLEKPTMFLYNTKK